MATSEYLRSGDDRFYVCPFQVEYLRSLPWGEELFDVFLVVLDDAGTGGNTRSAIAELVKLNNDWIETFGAAAEQLHDEIDQASVACGRQNAIGDGSPMTAWHDDVALGSDLFDYISRGGHGSCDYKLVAIVGKDSVSSFIGGLKKQLRVPIGEVR